LTLLKTFSIFINVGENITLTFFVSDWNVVNNYTVAMMIIMDFELISALLVSFSGWELPNLKWGVRVVTTYD